MTMVILRAFLGLSRGDRAGRMSRMVSSGLLGLLVLLGCVKMAGAQFSGPALGSGTTVNHALTPTTDPAILYPPAREIRLAEGDVLVVHLYGMADYLPTARVAQDGTIQLPLIGVLQVKGITVHALELLIAQRLSDAGMYRNPQVSVQITESPNQTVTVIGEAHGVIPVGSGKRLLDVLSAAGGLPSTASHIVTINRPGVAAPIVVDLGTNPAQSNRADVPIFALDTVVVSRVGVVYALGAFKTQLAVPLVQDSPLTLMQLATLAGGVGYEGKYKDLRIIRTVGVTRTVVKINVKKVIDGKLPDPVLQADDIVFLPTDSMKAAIKVGGIGTALGFASLLLFAFPP